MKKLIVLIVCFTFTAFAESPEKPTSNPTTKESPKDAAKESKEPKSAKPDDKLSITTGSVTIDGNVINYEATSGTMAMKDESNKPRANFFFTAYRKVDGKTEKPDRGDKSDKTEHTETDYSHRPISFVFNGGPGAASVWLHIGAVGPKSVKLLESGIPVGPPHRYAAKQKQHRDRR